MHSLYEIETTVKRVARHQGLSWGIAEEAGKIVRSLEQSELPGLECFNRLISFPYNKCETVIDLTKNNHKNEQPNNHRRNKFFKIYFFNFFIHIHRIYIF